MQGWSCSYEELNIGLGSEKDVEYLVGNVFILNFFCLLQKFGLGFEF